MRVILFKSGPTLKVGLTYIKQQPDGFLERVISSMYHRVITGDLDRPTIVNISRSLGRNTGYKFEVSYPCGKVIDALSESLTLGVGAIVEAAVILAPTMEWRASVEAEYNAINGGHDPSFLSDAFLRLWKKHYSGEATPLEMQFYTALKTSSIQIAILAAQVDNLRKVLGEVVPMANKTPPTKDRLLSATGEELRRIAASWDIVAPTGGNQRILRSHLLRFFGYSNTLQLKHLRSASSRKNKR